MARNLEKAYDFAQKSVSVEAMLPIQQGHCGALFAFAGHEEEARAFLEKLLGRSNENYASGSIALIHAALGEIDEAFYWIQKAKDERSKAIIYAGWPWFKYIHDDPRYESLLKEIGFSNPASSV